MDYRQQRPCIEGSPASIPLARDANTENEFLPHLFFFCLSSRAAWFISRIQMRTDGIPVGFWSNQILLMLKLRKDRKTKFVLLLKLEIKVYRMNYRELYVF
jgi:hypothetical protein